MRKIHALRSRVVGVSLAAVLALPLTARADAGPAVAPASRAAAIWLVSFDASAADTAAAGFDPWRIEWLPEAAAAGGLSHSVTNADVQGAQPRPRAKAIEYSDAYNTRRKIHFYASFATVPLAATEWVLGQKLYNGTGGDSTRSAHAAVAASLGVLFGVNTVTGVWNLVESRKDPNHRTKRLVHGILMLAADAGFVATAAMAPDDDDYGEDYTSSRSAHRAVAISSLVTALTSYVIMLVGR